MDSKELIELAYDVQSGLGNVDVPDFEEVRTMGMAATLAMHIRGLGEIDYEILRKVSEHYFSIPSYALKEVVNVLAEIEYVEVTRIGKRIKSIIPDVPHFGDIYTGVGQYFTFSDLNEHEQGTLLILSQLRNKPENKDRLQNVTGIDQTMLSRCIEIGNTGNYLKTFRARGKDILASPFYFADNLDSLADITAKIGATQIENILSIIKEHQGWPLSLIEKNLELGGRKMTQEQKDLLLHLCQEGVLKPPSIDFKNGNESFIFTPAPGNSRLNPANREIYERAMALVSCVRKGQLLAEKYPILYPERLLASLRSKGYLRSNSEAIQQYKNLAVLRVGVLKQAGGSRWEFHLLQTEENVAALDLAINLLETGDLKNSEINNDARLAFTKDEKYVQSVISSAELKKRSKLTLSEETQSEFDELILAY